MRTVRIERTGIKPDKKENIKKHIKIKENQISSINDFIESTFLPEELEEEIYNKSEYGE